MIFDDFINTLTYDNLIGVYQSQNPVIRYVLVSKDGKDILYKEKPSDNVDDSEMEEINIESISSLELLDFTKDYLKIKTEAGNSTMNIDKDEINDKLKDSNISIEFKDC